MKPSEAYTDALYETIETWFRSNLPPDHAENLCERILAHDDDLVPRILELTGIELRNAIEHQTG